jgi:steroid 5-alpha reductase family enzyme
MPQGLYTTELLSIFCYMTTLFCIAMIIRRNDIVDVAWGFGFVLVAATGAYLQPLLGPRQLLLFAMIVVWAVRLSSFIFMRNHGRPEDSRYKAWRDSWGRWFVPRSFLQIFMLQGLLLFIIALPVMTVMSSERQDLGAFEIIGAMIFALGLVFEAAGDQQKSNFKKDPSSDGKIITTGLWKYTRHPNYFGEVTLWWGVYLFTLGDLQAWWTIIGPLAISFLILKVSGIPMLEKPYEHRADFQEYKRRTNAFFPGPQKKS